MCKWILFSLKFVWECVKSFNIVSNSEKSSIFSPILIQIWDMAMRQMSIATIFTNSHNLKRKISLVLEKYRNKNNYSPKELGLLEKKQVKALLVLFVFVWFKDLCET